MASVVQMKAVLCVIHFLIVTIKGQNQCGDITSEKEYTFLSPSTYTPVCTLRVNVLDSKVTQLRLDFRTFRLAQPTNNNFNYGSYLCRNDNFTVVTSAGSNSNLAFQNLCGENSGQHIYVPVNATLGTASVDLHFITANRANNPGLITPEWNIKITQIDCSDPDTEGLCGLLATPKLSNQICGTQADPQSGVCKSSKDCLDGRGTPIGSCALSEGVCCQYVYTCGNSTSERLSYFKSPAVVPTLCSFRVNIYDKRITQLRLDFKTFRLAQPTNNNVTFEAYFCRNDTFSVVTSAGFNGNLGFQNLCGENTGQHIYVPVNATLGPASVALFFSTANRTDDPGLITPEWNIKITHIDGSDPDTKDLRAPAGCLQYYPDPSGSFQSFNYNGGAGHYQGLLNYAICFKRYDTICSNQYIADGFQLPTNDFATEYGYYACNDRTVDIYNPYSRDYLFIPDATTSNGANASLWCGTSLLNNRTTTNAPGPMYVFFRTDAISNEFSNGNEIGFNIRYQESSSGCYGAQSFFG